MELKQLSKQIGVLYRDTKDGVVRVIAGGGEEPVESSGILWTQPEIVITVSSAAVDTGKIAVIHGGDNPFSARLLGWDERFGLAVLRVEGLSSWTRWSELEMVDPGELVFALGYREIRAGIVSSTEESRQNAWGGIVKPWVALDFEPTRAQAGGALVTCGGAFAGMLCADSSAQQRVLGYGQLQNLVQAIIVKGIVVPGYLGVRTAVQPGHRSARARMRENNTDDPQLEALGGIVVTSVEPGTAADAAGVLPGDIITEVDGDRVEVPRALFMALRTKNAGENIVLRYFRGPIAYTISVELGEKPQD